MVIIVVVVAPAAVCGALLLWWQSYCSVYVNIYWSLWAVLLWEAVVVRAVGAVVRLVLVTSWAVLVSPRHSNDVRGTEILDPCYGGGFA